jgi:hypothetical protein
VLDHHSESKPSAVAASSPVATLHLQELCGLAHGVCVETASDVPFHVSFEQRKIDALNLEYPGRLVRCSSCDAMHMTVIANKKPFGAIHVKSNSTKQADLCGSCADVEP